MINNYDDLATKEEFATVTILKSRYNQLLQAEKQLHDRMGNSLFACCEHCGCSAGSGRVGHDDTCKHGCND